MKKHFLVLGTLALFVGCESRTPVQVKADNAKANNLMEAARADLGAGKADSASAKIATAQKLYLDNDSAAATAIIAGMVHQLGEAKQPEHVALTLGKLSESGLKALKKGDRIVYYQDSSVNSYFLNQLKSRAGEWPKLHKQTLQAKAKEKKQQAELIEVATKMQADGRRVYATQLRNNFLDGGLDIDVAVSGKNATYLKLKYALFGAVWGRKFETEGLFAKFRDMGFSKVEITDGYDYDYIWTL